MGFSFRDILFASPNHVEPFRITRKVSGFIRACKAIRWENKIKRKSESEWKYIDAHDLQPQIIIS